MSGMSVKINTFFYNIEEKKVSFSIICFITAFFFLLIASPYTSILNPYYGYDSAVFMVIGRGINHGFVPYADLFDHKGPLLYFINALGFLIADNKLGILLVQTLFMTAVLYLIYKIGRLYVTPIYTMIVIASFMFFYCAMISEGDMTEEWSLVATFLPIFISLNYFKDNVFVKKFSLKYSFIFGLCLGVHAMIRINNAVILCGMLLYLGYCLIKEKEYSRLAINVIVVIIGCCCIVLPFVLYFYFNGAFDDFVYANFIYNFLYASEGAKEKTLVDILLVIIRISSYIVLLFCAKGCTKKKLIDCNSAWISIISGGIAALTMFIGYGWLHYYLVYIPIALVGMIFAILYITQSFDIKGDLRYGIKISQRLVIVATLLFCLIPFSWNAVRHVGKNLLFDFAGYYDENVSSVEEIVSEIPESERNSVWSYDVQPQFYLYSDILPCYKYFCLQSFQSEGNEYIEPGIKEMLSSDPPKWIVVGKNDVANEDLQKKLKEDYSLFSETDYGMKLRLFRLKGEETVK